MPDEYAEELKLFLAKTRYIPRLERPKLEHEPQLRHPKETNRNILSGLEPD